MGVRLLRIELLLHADKQLYYAMFRISSDAQFDDGETWNIETNLRFMNELAFVKRAVEEKHAKIKEEEENDVGLELLQLLILDLLGLTIVLMYITPFYERRRFTQAVILPQLRFSGTKQ
jgi:hypothetical protein